MDAVTVMLTNYQKIDQINDKGQFRESPRKLVGGQLNQQGGIEMSSNKCMSRN